MSEAREVDLRLWVLRARALWHLGSTSSPGRLGPGTKGPRGRPAPGRHAHESEGPQGRPAPPGDSVLDLSTQAVHQLSRVTRFLIQKPTGLTNCPGRLGPGSECPRCRPVVLGDSGPGQRARGFNQISWATQTHAQGPTVSTRCPGLLRNVPEVWRCQTTILGNSCMVRGNPGSTTSTRRLGMGLSAHGVDQLSLATPALVHGPEGSTSGTGLFGPVPKGPRCQPSLSGDSFRV